MSKTELYNKTEFDGLHIKGLERYTCFLTQKTTLLKYNLLDKCLWLKLFTNYKYFGIILTSSFLIQINEKRKIELFKTKEINLKQNGTSADYAVVCN